MVMPTDVTIAHESGIKSVSDQPPEDWRKTGSPAVQTLVIEVTRDYLTWEDDPVLAELWDNEQDAAYDDL